MESVDRLIDLTSTSRGSYLLRLIDRLIDWLAYFWCVSFPDFLTFSNVQCLILGRKAASVSSEDHSDVPDSDEESSDSQADDSDEDVVIDPDTTIEDEDDEDADDETARKRTIIPRDRDPVYVQNRVYPPLQLPPSSEDLIVPNDLVLQALGIYEILRRFSNTLQLTPFRFEDFCCALVAEENSKLLAEIFRYWSQERIFFPSRFKREIHYHFILKLVMNQSINQSINREIMSWKYSLANIFFFTLSINLFVVQFFAWYFATARPPGSGLRRTTRRTASTCRPFASTAWRGPNSCVPSSAARSSTLRDCASSARPASHVSPRKTNSSCWIFSARRVSDYPVPYAPSSPRIRAFSMRNPAGRARSWAIWFAAIFARRRIIWSACRRRWRTSPRASGFVQCVDWTRYVLYTFSHLMPMEFQFYPSSSWKLWVSS